VAYKDLIASELGSEWQASCLAGLYVYCHEMSRRK
jgi:hypothetical protein